MSTATLTATTHTATTLTATTLTRHDESAGGVVLEALRTRTEQLWDAEHGVRADMPEAVTEMRVITRQLRSTLSGFSRVLDPEVTRAVVAELAWLGRQLGEENDSHAMIKELHRLFSALPRESTVCRVAADVERELGQLSAQGTHVTQAALASRRYAALRRALNLLVADPPFTTRAAKPAIKELPKSVAKAMRKLDRRLAAAEVLPAGPGRYEALHEARKADKLLRYVTEVAAPVVGKPALRLSRQAKKLQDLLGDYQDAVVTRPVLHKLGTAAEADGRPAGTYWELDALEQARTERVLGKLPRRLGSLHDKGVWLPQHH
jgi:CHAD domain-containing protein